MSGKLIILSGPSGVGKDTIIDRWRALNPLVERVVACTTRSPRSGEVDGVDYHFLSHEAFMARAKEGAFLEFKSVHDQWYATPKSRVDELLAAGKIAILKIDVQGALTVMQVRPDAITVFLHPPSMKELESRIRSRNTDSAEQIEKRLKAAQDEIAMSDEYQHNLVNADVDETVGQLQEICR